MHYFIIAGEASGDLHAAALIGEIKKADGGARFTFLGGDKMSAASGSAPVIDYRDMAFMGFSEVFRNLGKISSNLKRARSALAEAHPDALILVDYPSFNLKVAKTALGLGIPVYYYISPKVWAWKEWRVKAIRRLVRRVLCILPFEVDFYARHGMEVDYVGNPSVEEIDRAFSRIATEEPKRPVIALLPGSRRGEIKCNLPVMADVARQFPQYRAVVAGAPGIEADYYSRFTRLPVVFDKTFELLASARAALVTSGTATLETALAGVPQVVMYRSNGSKLAYNLMKRLLKVSYVSLPNLIAGRAVVPEMLLHMCTPDAVAAELGKLTGNTASREEMLDGYGDMRRRLTSMRAAPTAAKIITDDMKNK